MQLTLTACEDLTDVSAQGGAPAWAATTSEPGATPVKYDEAEPVTVTIGGEAC